ncbi:Dps family protein [Sabulicella rubraurantiaca]|uniref:Dps family protein n=1 Tax=Sabulicella rubraurantiaca TaxID=2811429 RepID=UPI001A9729B7|nr:DNA starvation/stationary phase protection protein [Sabulicella rubraurantiaca]
MSGKNEGVTEGLKGFLADTYVLLAKTQACHWNARGKNFYGLHKLTEEQYQELFQAVDDIAERIRALGGDAPVSLADMLGLASLDEAKEVHATDEAVRLLTADNRSLAERAKELALDADEADDLATADMLTERVQVHEKAAWLLSSHVT